MGNRSVIVKRIHRDLTRQPIRPAAAKDARTTRAPGQCILFAALRDVLVSVRGQKQPVRVETRMK
ncbi:MAG: hypothetical protein KH751_04200 [Actinomyces sp.]|nr:hypothetical protein [Actinomyces sp.]